MRWPNERFRAAGAVPAFKGYRGYPATICSSINEQVVHGIPSSRELHEGDIISIDLGARMDGFTGIRRSLSASARSRPARQSFSASRRSRSGRASRR
jgi:methionyl aminopeptidase